MLQAQAVSDGMRTMLHDGVLKAIAGLTTIEEVYRVVG
jgi:type II secretory ATPase GspE/PulE/Tfp pilus assembly ATPase PilB-like protein